MPSGVAQGVPLPAPVGGWDGISPLANMPVDRAVTLDNWVPRPGWIEPRPGYLPWSTGASNKPVQTVMAYNGPGYINKLFGIAAGSVYDCSIQGAATKTGVSVANSRAQYTMFSNASTAQQYLMFVTGNDPVWAFDGSKWLNPTITVDPNSLPFDPTTFVHVASHKGRLWFVPKNANGAVYLETVGGFQGDAFFFPLGQFMTKGGYVTAIGTWTIDTSQFVDEYIAFITSRGQVIVYQGTDPSTQATWSLVGIYNLGSPVGGPRCFLRISGDLLIITVDGLVPMTEMLSTDRSAANRVSLTSVIMNPMAQAAKAYKTNFGWGLCEYAKGTLVILNIPILENTMQMQFVMNTITGAWSRFFDASYGGGIPANCWEVDAQDRIFFGGNDGNVYQWDVSSGDNGAAINCACETAFNSFGNAAQLKRYTMVQPLITTTGNPIPSIGINVDFETSPPLSTEQPVQPAVPLWDQVKWDGFQWPVQQTQTNNWISVCGTGHYVSIVTKVATAPSKTNPSSTLLLQLNGWNILAERGAFV